jgi:hypothetical protein
MVRGAWLFVGTDPHPVHSAVNSVGARLCTYSTNAYHCIILTCAHLAHAVLDTKYALVVWVTDVGTLVDNFDQHKITPE